MFVWWWWGAIIPPTPPARSLFWAPRAIPAGYKRLTSKSCGKHPFHFYIESPHAIALLISPSFFYSFRLNSSRCVDGVLRMNVLPSSKIHVICPTSVTVLDTVQSPKPKHELYENLWIVYDKESFEKCDASVTTGKPSWQASRLLMQCDTPLELKYFTLVFQEFSAVGGGLAFPPGKEYYFFGK